MKTTILVAYDKNRVIGFKNSIPWRIPEDQKRFKERTIGHSVIMGRKTWESLPDRYRPLPDRHNIIVSKTYSDNPEKFMSTMPIQTSSPTVVVPSLESAIKLTSSESEVFIIGGSQIYEEAISKKIVNRIIVSFVNGDYEGDAFFPELDSSWSCTELGDYVEFKELEFIKES